LWFADYRFPKGFDSEVWCSGYFSILSDLATIALRSGTATRHCALSFNSLPLPIDT